MSIEILKSLAKDSRIFTIHQVSRKTQIKKEILKVILSRMEEKGYIERIERGKYMIIPLESEKGKYTLHEFIIASSLIEPSAISYWSALHHYGLTEQIPTTVFIQSPKRKKKTLIKIFGVYYQIIRIKEDKFFGLRKDWIDGIPVNITDKEKTIIDCLDKPQYAGGIIEVAKALMKDSADYERLTRYALRINNFAVIRRLGYLCDQIGISLNLPLPRSKKYLLLDPTMPPKGVNNPKWRLIINHSDIHQEILNDPRP